MNFQTARSRWERLVSFLRKWSRRVPGSSPAWSAVTTTEVVTSTGFNSKGTRTSPAFDAHRLRSLETRKIRFHRVGPNRHALYNILAVPVRLCFQRNRPAEFHLHARHNRLVPCRVSNKHGPFDFREGGAALLTQSGGRQPANDKQRQDHLAGRNPPSPVLMSISDRFCLSADFDVQDRSITP